MWCSRTTSSNCGTVFLAAPVAPAPPPWQAVLDSRTPIGGLQGIGFTVHPENDHDLVMVVSMELSRALRRRHRREDRPEP